LGGGKPKPRKLRLASCKIITGTKVENNIIRDGIIFGKICLVSILKGEQPILCAACRYTFSLMLRVALLTILEPEIPKLRPIIIINCHTPGPTIDTRSIIRINEGIHIHASTTLCNTISNRPPR
jgi:hypothetical protein